MEQTSASAVYGEHRPLKPYAKEQKRLMLTASVFGIALLAYIAGNGLISMFLTSDAEIYNRYMNDELFALAMNMLNTAFCVFVPFAFVYFLLRRFKRIDELPLGGAKDSYNAVLLVFIGLGFCYIANLLTSYLTMFASAFGIESYAANYTPPETQTGAFSVGMQILGYAVLPALFEEFAYRGVIMQSLRRYGDWFAILMSSLLFGLMHGNLVQVPFAFTVGILLGYCTVASGTMWVGIAIHFGNNLISALQSVIGQAYGEAAGYAFVSAVMVALMLFGVVCAVLYACRNRRFFRLNPGKYRFMPHKGALVLCAPSVLVACVYFCYITLMDIVGFYDWFMQGVMNLTKTVFMG